MEVFSRYVLSVISAALVVGILTDLHGKNGSIHVPMRMIGGLFLLFVVLTPAADLDFTNLDRFFEDYSVDGAYYAEAGNSDAELVYRSIIKTKAEAYILDKAKALQADIEASVTLSQEETVVPVSARLKGNVSPYAKGELTRIMEEELGIAKEHQQWIG